MDPGCPELTLRKVVERLLGTQFRQQDPVRLHAQAGLEQLLRRDARDALIVLGVEQAHVIGMAIQHQFLGILDGHQALIAGNFPNQRLGPGRLAGPGGPGNEDILAAAYGEAHERLEFARRQQTQQFAARWRRACLVGAPRAAKDTASAPVPRCSRPRSAGRRMEIATQPAVVAGGMTICTRSPVGSDADSSGDVASMRCWVELATSFAKPAAPIEVGKRPGARGATRYAFRRTPRTAD